MPKLNKFFTSWFFDVIGCMVSSVFTFWACNMPLVNFSVNTYLINALFASTVVMIAGYQTGMLHPITRSYVGLGSFYKVALLVFIFSALHFCILFQFFGLNLSQAARGMIIESMSSGFVLLIFKSIDKNIFRKKSASSLSKAKIIIYGAGEAGEQLLRALMYDPGVEVMGFIDDNAALIGGRIGGKRIYSPFRLHELIEKYSLTNLIVAIPSAPREDIRKICDKMAQFPIKISTLPHLTQLATGSIQVSDIRDINLDDLLGREEIKRQHSLLKDKISGKNVLITGAGGSIGSELCRQIILHHPAKLILIDNSEIALFSVLSDLRKHKAKSPSTEIISLLKDVTNSRNMNDVFSIWLPDTVFHAAAYKHVPIVEENISAGVSVNILGTLNIVTSALQYGIKNLILISTDKAVNPTNIMGATKRVAELIVQAAYESPKGFFSLASLFYGGIKEDISKKLLSNAEILLSNPTFSIVRFGNVLGSSGSVVPIFLEQISNGGPVKITHPDIVRYFMTIPEAAQLVIEANEMASGGEVFILDMGEPRKILDLAKKLIHLAGYKVKGEGKDSSGISIEFIGLRPGEKLYEELLVNDNAALTEHPRIFQAKENYLPVEKLFALLSDLQRGLKDNDVPSIYENLVILVDGFKAIPEPVDTIWCAANKP
jgi:FlaA1/EpsC-like NDP-sugar epimerase